MSNGNIIFTDAGTVFKDSTVVFHKLVPVSLALSKPLTILSKGEIRQLVVMDVDSAGDQVDVTVNCTFSISDSTVATVNNIGLVTGVSMGKTSLNIEYGALTLQIIFLVGASRDMSYYIALITHQYQNSSKFLAWLAACLQPLQDAAHCLDHMWYDFDLDNAVGIQLDTLGLISGVSRTVGFQPSNSVSPILDDPTYRILLKSKILLNQWNGQIQTIEAAWGNIFPGGHIYIQDNGDMSITITTSGGITSIQNDLITNDYIIPKPEGVFIIGSAVPPGPPIFGTKPYFGFDQSNDYIAGFDISHWI
jgi:hypothetical protein